MVFIPKVVSFSLDSYNLIGCRTCFDNSHGGRLNTGLGAQDDKPNKQIIEIKIRNSLIAFLRFGSEVGLLDAKKV